MTEEYGRLSQPLQIDKDRERGGVFIYVGHDGGLSTAQTDAKMQTKADGDGVTKPGGEETPAMPENYRQDLNAVALLVLQTAFRSKLKAFLDLLWPIRSIQA